MTEEEAKTKLCPMVNAPCEGSDCMMWRKEKPTHINADLTADQQKEVLDRFGQHGHCGLAGPV